MEYIKRRLRFDIVLMFKDPWKEASKFLSPLQLQGHLYIYLSKVRKGGGRVLDYLGRERERGGDEKIIWGEGGGGWL